MKVITIANVKGGVGKSITALFFSKILASNNKKVLLLDLDSQNSLTSYFVDNYSEIEGFTILEALLDQQPISETVKELQNNLFFIPADISLSNLTLCLTENRDFKLYSVLESIKDDYDYIIIDTPPSLHTETKLAFVLSNYIIIPTLLEKWATRSIEIVFNYLKTKNSPLQKIIKADLEKVFILPTMVEKNRKVQTIVLDELSEKYGQQLLPSIAKRTDVQKLSYLGKEFDFAGIQAYNEYSKALDCVFESITTY